MRFPTGVAFALALVVAAATRLSHASADVGAVLVTGSAPEQQRTIVASAVRSAAHSGAWQLVETPLDDAEIATLVGCLDARKGWSCAEPVVTKKGIQRLIIVRVEVARQEGKPALALVQQVLLPGSEVTTADRRICPDCTDETLTRVAFDLTTALLKEAAAGTARTKIAIRSTPPGAWITLDNNNVGLTDRTYATYPGRHVVIVQLDGYETEQRVVEVREDQETAVPFVLRRKGAGGQTDSVARRYLVPGVLGVAGGAAFGVGLALQITKDPPEAPQDQPKRLYSTAGISLMVGGGLVLGYALYSGIRVRQKHAARISTPTVSLSSDGAAIGWAGSF